MSTSAVNLQTEYEHAKSRYRRAYRQARRAKMQSTNAVEYWRSVMRQYRYHLNNARREE